MSRFKEFAEEVRAKNDIADVIGGDAKLEKTGNEWKCCSPIRGEKTPSFWVYPGNQSWHDFGTGDGGDVFSYVIKRDRCTFSQAVVTLARRVGITPYWLETEDPLDAEALSYLERRTVQELMTEAVAYWHNALPMRVREYIKDFYGFTDATIDTLQIGWAEGGLANYFLEVKEYSREAALKTGLLLDMGSEVIDLFVNRIVFPYWFRGFVVYTIARRTEWSSDEAHEKAKYKKQLTHTEKHSYVSKTVGNDWFWGEDSTLKRVDMLLITEGVTDAISAWQAGIAVISPVTTRFRGKDNPKLLRHTERTDRVVICNDADILHDGRRPGEEGALQTATVLFQQKRDVRMAILPRRVDVDKIDVNEYAKTYGDEALKKVFDKALRYPEFLIQQIPDKGLEPAELDEKLKPVFEVVASLTPVQRDAYIRAIAKRFKLPKRTCEEQVRAFDPPERMLTDEEKKAEEIKDAADDAKQERLRGRVLEDFGFYYTKSLAGIEEVVSSFSLICKQRIQIDANELLSCDVLIDKGRTIEGHVFPRTAWGSRRDFIKSFPSPDMQWTGTDDHVQGVLRLVTAQKVPLRKGTTNLGYHEGPDGPRWVWPDGVISPSGFLIDPDVVYVKTSSSLADRLMYEPTPFDELTTLARDILPGLLKLNAPEVILPILGWFFSTPFKPRLAKLLGHFPILMVWGTQGSGKTSIIKEIFWPLLGVARRTEPYSCTETEFALMRQVSSTDSIPIAFDEFKPRDMGKIKVDKFLRMLRRIYGGEVEERGRIDLSVTSFTLEAPTAVMGEAQPEGDPALLERLVTVSPDKNYLMTNELAQTEFKRISRLQLSRLSGPYIQWTLSQNVKDGLAQAREITDRMLAKSGHAGRLPMRVYDNLLVVSFGLVQYRAWAQELGIELPKVDIVRAFHAMTTSILEGEGANVKDAFDAFLEALSAYAHRGILEEGVHYAIIDGMLALYLPACHQVYLEERKRSGQEDDTNGPRALKRIAKEKLERGSYVTSVDKRVQLGDSFVRCVMLNMGAVPEALDFEVFPAKANRTWGGQNRMPQRWGWEPGQRGEN